MPKDPHDLYDDVIVIPFRLPWSVGEGARASDETESWQRDADGASPAVPAPSIRLPDPVDVSWPAGEGQIVMARIRGQPYLVISGVSDGELKLWQRGVDKGEPQQLAVMTLDREGSLWDLRGRFIGWLWADETADLHPEWLRGLGAALPGGASAPAQREARSKGPVTSIMYVEPEPAYDSPMDQDGLVLADDHSVSSALVARSLAEGRDAWRGAASIYDSAFVARSQRVSKLDSSGILPEFGGPAQWPTEPV
jgi:hypothetical protein